MTYKLTCPGCDRYLSSIFHAYADGQPCPECGSSLAASGDQYYRQLPPNKSPGPGLHKVGPKPWDYEYNPAKGQKVSFVDKGGIRFEGTVTDYNVNKETGEMELTVEDTPYIEQLESALLEVNGGFTGGKLIGELGDVAQRLISALSDRGIKLTVEEGK